MKSILLLLFFLSTIHTAFSQFKMVRNINTMNANGVSSLTGAVTVGNNLLFNGEYIDSTTFESKIAVWKTDGTFNGTSPTNLSLTLSSSNLSTFSSDSVMFFIYEHDSIVGSSVYRYHKLYRFNPITDIISPIKQFATGYYQNSQTSERDFIAFNNSYYFRAYTQAEGFELWKTDGTTQGTVMVKDIVSGTSSSGITNFVHFNNSIYFSSIDAASNVTSIWKSDGTSNGTLKVKDIGSNINGENISKLIVSGNKLFIFTTKNLWVSDGTTLGTTIHSNNRPVSDYCADVNGILYLTFNYRQLWKTDGVTLTQVKDFVPITNVGAIQKMFNYNGILIFSAGKSGYAASYTNELWRSDGTDAGTYIVKSINNGLSGCNPENFTILNNELYFTAWHYLTGKELYKTDGTSQGTIKISEVAPEPANTFPYAGGVDKIYKVNSQLILDTFTWKYGHELWKSDGTILGTTLIKDINLIEVSSSYSSLGDPRILCQTEQKVYFNIHDGSSGYEIWETDGTFAGTKLLNDFYPGLPGGFGKRATSAILNNELYITTWNETIRPDGLYVGNELHKINLTTKTMTLVKDIITSGSLEMRAIVKANNLLFFKPALGVKGHDLWRTDGTDQGTFRVRDFSINNSYPEQEHAGESNIDLPTEFNGQLYFFAREYNNGGSNGKNLWKSDGTSQGTVKIKDFGDNYGWYRGLKIFNNKIFSAIGTPNLGRELWVSDGTEIGTFNLIDIQPGMASSDPLILEANDNYLFFVATDSQGTGLWRTDGTPLGTTKITNINDNIYPTFKAIVANNIMYFTPYSYSNKLHRTDGTSLGTFQITLPNVNSQSSINDMIAIGRNCYLTVNTEQGTEFWRTNGNANGTFKVGFNFKKNSISSVGVQSDLMKLGNKIIFFANDGFHGKEFWYFDTCDIRETITSGNWNNSQSWSCGQIPATFESPFVNQGHTITLNNDVFLKGLNLSGSLNYDNNSKINFIR